MPYPRRRAFDDGERLTAGGYLPGAVAPTGRPRTGAEAQQDYRSGHRAANRSPVLRWDTHRNGLPPFRPYVYHGAGPFAWEEPW
jgi:hypothetical protein